MRVLFYVEPFIERQRPLWKAGWLQFARLFDAALPEADFKVLVGEPLADAAAAAGFTGERCLTADFEPFVGRVGRDALDITSRWYLGEEGPVVDRVAEYLGTRLAGFSPDVIISFSPVPALRALFPDALVLHAEVGMFSRRPFPMTLYLDGLGMFRDSVLRRRSAEILAYRTDQEGLAFVRGLRHRYLDDGLARLLPAVDAVYGERLAGWRARLLLPLQFSGYYAFDANCAYASQLDLLTAVLREVPPDVAVVVTEHPENPALDEESARNLMQRHPNLVWDERGRTMHAASQLLLLRCDAVATVSSAVGMHAMLYRKPLVSLGDAYFSDFADGHALSELDDVLARGWDPERDHVLHWLFSHYYVHVDSLAQRGWFEAFCASCRHDAETPIPPIYAPGELRALYLPPGAPSLSGIVGAKLAATSPLPAPRQAPAVRAIAFHLPQFHAIPENDAWWGEGFTEWTNVRRGEPLFEGHYQPHVPAGDDYYDLGDVQVLARQAALAREHGLEGFCFYHYWFDGRRLLERPVDQLLAHPGIDLPFCLCWANENWTRRWDGGEQEVLVRQSYSAEFDERFAMDLLPYLRDPRYIRVDGRPLVLVYRLDIIPEAGRVTRAWREIWRREGVGEVFLVGVESFRALPPAASGLDAACEFLPHQVDFDEIPPARPINRIRDPRMTVGDYAALARSWTQRPRPAYRRFRGLVPSWDNAARRRKGGATLLVDASPARYEDWLRQTVALTLAEQSGDERLVFINAWNEWGEGCHLEPDQRHGTAYLEATRRVLFSAPEALGADQAQAGQSARIAREALEAWACTRQMAPAGTAPPARLAVGVQGVGTSAELSRRHFIEAGLDPEAVSLLPDDGGSSLATWADAVDADWLLLVPAGSTVIGEGLGQLREELSKASQCRAACLDLLLTGPNDACEPLLRPDPNLDLLLSDPARQALGWVLSRTALRDVGGFGPAAGPAVVLDVLLRMIEAQGLSGLGHLASPVFSVPAPTALPAEFQSVVMQHLARRGYLGARLFGGPDHSLRIEYGHPDQPRVSIIIPTRDQLPMLQRCIETLMEKTRYGNYELLIVDNDSRTPEARAWLDGLAAMGLEQVRVLSYPHPFNYSAINNLAAREARGEYLLLLNNDTAVLREDWLDAMLNHAQRPEVGVVGARLLFPDGSLQHAGIVLGLRGPAEHPFIGLPGDLTGASGRLHCDQDLSAVTGACLMVRRSLYEALGGLDEDAFKVAYNDVDFCLRVVQSGHLVVWTPHAVLMHVGSVSQHGLDPEALEAKRERFAAEQDAMYARWLPQLANDPAYNPNLSLQGPGYELDRLPRRRHTDRPLVLAHPCDPFGCGNYRVYKPFQALLRAGRIQGSVNPGWPDLPALARVAPDVHLLQRPTKDTRLAAAEGYRRHVRAFTVYELDDYLPGLPMGSAHRAEMPTDVRRMIRRGLALADRFVVSTHALAEAFSGWHADIRVAENRLPADWWGELARTRRDGPRPRVGWAGGAGHGGDLALVADVIRALAGEVDWVFFGMCPEALQPYLAEYHAGIEISRYPDYLAQLDLDLAIAPLEDNLFNRCKSQLRLLEYGACGYPVVCSDVHTFAEHGLPVTRVKNRYKDWVDAIRAHLADPDASAAEGERLQAAVRAEWMLEGKGLDAWFEAWTPG